MAPLLMQLWKRGGDVLPPFVPSSSKPLCLPSRSPSQSGPRVKLAPGDAKALATEARVGCPSLPREDRRRAAAPLARLPSFCWSHARFPSAGGGDRAAGTIETGTPHRKRKAEGGERGESREREGEGERGTQDRREVEGSREGGERWRAVRQKGRVETQRNRRGSDEVPTRDWSTIYGRTSLRFFGDTEGIWTARLLGPLGESWPLADCCSVEAGEGRIPRKRLFSVALPRSHSSTKRHNIDASRSSSASPWKACEVGWEERSRWLGSERWRAEARDVEQEETGQGAQEKTGVAGNRGPCDGGFPDLKESQKKRRHFVAPPKRKDREERGGRRDWTECEHGEARLDAVQGDGAAEAVAWMQGQDETKRQLETLLPTTKHVALWLNALAGHLERMQRRQNQQPNRVEMRVADAPQGGLWQLLFDAAAAAKATCEKTHAVANKEMSSSSGHGKESTSGHRQSQGRLPTLRLPSSLSPSSISPSSSARSSSPASACRTAGACFWVWAVELLCRRQREECEGRSLESHRMESSFSPCFSPPSVSCQSSLSLLHGDSVSSSSLSPPSSAAPLPSSSSLPSSPSTCASRPRVPSLRGLAMAANACVRLHKWGRENPQLAASLSACPPWAAFAPSAHPRSTEKNLPACSSRPVFSLPEEAKNEREKRTARSREDEACSSPALAVGASCAAPPLPSLRDLRACLLALLLSIRNWEAAAQEMNEQDASLLVHACATAELFFPPLFSALSLRLQARRTLPPLANRLPTSSEETSSREEDAKPNKDRENRDDSGTPRPTDLPSSLPSKEMAASSPPPAKHHQHASLGTERLPALSDAGAQSATTTPAGREEVDFLSSFSPQGLSLLLHGFAALRVSLPPTLASRLARSALDKLHATSLAEATEKTERRQAGRMEEAGRGAVAGAVNGRRDAWLGSGVQKAEEERQRSLAPASHGPDFQGSQMKTTRPDGGAGEAGKGTDAGGQSRKTGEVSGVCTPKQAVRLVYALCELPDVPHPLAKHAAVLLSQGRLKTHPESFSIQGRLLALRCFLNFDVREPEGMHAIFLSLLCRGVPRSSGAMSASSAPFVCSSSPASLFSEQHFALLLHLLATAQATGALVFDSSSGKKISVSHPKSPLLADAKSRLLADQPLGDPTVSGLDAPAAARAPGVPSGQVSLFSLLPQFLRTHLAHFLPVATPQGLSSVFSAVAKLDAGRTVLHVNNRLLPLSGEEPLHIRGDRGGVLYADSLLAASCSRLLLSNRAEPRHLIACCFAAAASFAGTPHWHAALLFHAFHVPVAGRALAAGVCTPGRGHGAAAGEKMEQLRDASAVCASADGETSTITWPAKFVQPSLFSLLTCHSETQARNSTGAGVSFHSFTTPASESQLPHRLKAPDNVQWATAVFRGQTQSTEAGDAACCLSSASSNVVADEKRQKQGESPISEGRELQRGSRGHPVLAADRSACFQTGFSTTETINVTTTVQALSACGVTVQTVSQLQAVLLHLAFELGDIGGLSALHLRVLRASISILDYFLHTSLPYDQMRDEPLDDGRKPSKSLLECPDTKSDLPTFVGEHLSSLSPSYDREVCGKHVSSFDSCETDGGSQPHPAMQQACPRSPIKSQGNVCKAKLRGCGNDGNAIGEVSPHYPDLQSLSKRVKSSRLHCEVLDTVRSVVRVERKCESHGNTLKHPMQKVGPCLMVSEALIPPYVVDIAVLPVNRYRGSCNWV
ncbi:hypothetical protein TGGT1_309000 [Toxoplasma gondii GT1]|uniref:Sodium:solute symporter family domain protein n=2 Tax=Toxoplasma gondii TaxID=5811 RepID=S7W7M1_TOXGG|nr:hypothetical protein TGGT1_309000 [Toxoplasma gondii GT1]